MAVQTVITGDIKIRELNGILVADNGIVNSIPATNFVTSVGLSMPSAFNVANSPITSSGVLAVTGAGLPSQYIRGDGTLANFPSQGGGGSSVNYYLNGSINQGSFGGETYYQMNKTPITGTGSDFIINTNGYIAEFITNANDPSLLNIPVGNWNFELFFNASSNGGNPNYYIELYKYNGTSFTLIASNASNPVSITGGVNKDIYFSSLVIPATSLSITDRLAIRVFVNNDGRTITLHTESNDLCKVITNFSTGVTALNGLISQVQYFSVGTSGTDFNINSLLNTHTFNLPFASALNNGKLSSTDWSVFNNKQDYLGGNGLVKSTSGVITYITDNSSNWNTAYNDSIVSAVVTGIATKTLTLNQQDGGTIQASWTDEDTGLTSVGLTMPAAFSVANSPLTSNGSLAVSAVGTASQYIRGDGQLATFPSTGGAGSSYVYYLNGSIASSVVGYQQMANSAIIGGGTDFNLAGNGLIAQFLTDVGNPNRIQIPSGAWNLEMYFSVSSLGGSQKFYVDLYKYDGTTFTLISSGSTNPEEITGGTSTDLYLTSIAVPTTTLLATDRLAVRVYIVDNAVGRTVTLHTEDNNLCQILTTFSTGISSIDGLTATTQYLAVGTSGTDFNINSVLDTHTFNLPNASATSRGAITNLAQTIGGVKTFVDAPIVPALFLTDMTLGAGALYYNTIDNRLTLANYNVGGSVLFEVDGGAYSMYLNSDLTINLAGYLTNGFLKTSASTGRLVVDTTSYTPTSRLLSINGTQYDLSADRSWNVGTVLGSGTTSYLPKFTNANTIGNSLIYDNGTSVGIGTTALTSGTFYTNLVVKGGISVGQVIQSDSNSSLFLSHDIDGTLPFTEIYDSYLAFGIKHFNGTTNIQSLTWNPTRTSLGAGNFSRLHVFSATGNVTISNTATDAGFKLDVNGTSRVSGQLTLGSTITNGTYTYTLPSSTGTLAIIGDLVPYTGAITNVNLGLFSLSSYGVTLRKNALTSSVGSFNIESASGNDIGGIGYVSIGSTATTLLSIYFNGGVNSANFSGALLTGYRQYTLPDATGTLALTSQLSGFVNLTTNQTIGGIKTFSVDGSFNGVTIGRGAGSVSNNVALGLNALSGNSTGSTNTAIGEQALRYNLTGNWNTAIGSQALTNNSLSGTNTAVGGGAMFNNITGNGNTALGYNTLASITSGNSNTALGSGAGILTNGGSALTNAEQSLFIGVGARASAVSNTNETVIGFDARGNGSNTVTIGNSSITNNYFTGNIIGGAFIKIGGTSSQYLMADGSVTTGGGGGGGIGGSGTINYIPKFTASTTLGNSSIQDDGTTVSLSAILSGTKGNFTGSTGETFTVQGAIGEWAQRITGSASTGNSYGLLIAGGTNASDFALNVFNQGITTSLFNIKGNGVATFSGSINGTSLSMTLGASLATSSGNVLIGTITSIGTKLQVEGTTYTAGLSVNATQYSGDVTLNTGTTYVYAGSGGNTFTLQSSSGSNQVFIVKNNSAFNLTIARTGADVIIDNTGASVTSYTLAANKSIIIQQDGGTKNYIIVDNSGGGGGGSVDELQVALLSQVYA